MFTGEPVCPSAAGLAWPASKSFQLNGASLSVRGVRRDHSPAVFLSLKVNGVKLGPRPCEPCSPGRSEPRASCAQPWPGVHSQTSPGVSSKQAQTKQPREWKWPYQQQSQRRSVESDAGQSWSLATPEAAKLHYSHGSSRRESTWTGAHSVVSDDTDHECSSDESSQSSDDEEQANVTEVKHVTPDDLGLSDFSELDENKDKGFLESLLHSSMPLRQRRSFSLDHESEHQREENARHRRKKTKRKKSQKDVQKRKQKTKDVDEQKPSNVNGKPRERNMEQFNGLSSFLMSAQSHRRLSTRDYHSGLTLQPATPLFRRSSLSSISVSEMHWSSPRRTEPEQQSRAPPTRLHRYARVQPFELHPVSNGYAGGDCKRRMTLPSLQDSMRGKVPSMYDSQADQLARTQRSGRRRRLIFLSQTQSAFIVDQNVSAAPPSTPWPGCLENDYIECMADALAKQTLKEKVSTLVQEAKEEKAAHWAAQQSAEEEAKRLEKRAQQREKERLRARQRAEIYALNAEMAKLELEQFESFCQQQAEGKRSDSPLCNQGSSFNLGV